MNGKEDKKLEKNKLVKSLISSRESMTSLYTSDAPSASDKKIQTLSS